MIRTSDVVGRESNGYGKPMQHTVAGDALTATFPAPVVRVDNRQTKTAHLGRPQRSPGQTRRTCQTKINSDLRLDYDEPVYSCVPWVQRTLDIS